MIVFFILAAVFLFIGLDSLISKRNNTLLFLMLCALIPTSYAFIDYYSLTGIDAYDCYFFCFLPYLFRFNGQAVPKAEKQLLFLLGLLFVYFILSALNLLHIDKYLLKDVLIIMLPLFILIAHPYKVQYKIADIEKILILHCICNALYFILTLKGAFKYRDEYYEDNSFRYFGVAGYMSAFYLVWMHGKREYARFFFNKLSVLCYALAWITILISGYRMLLMATVLGIMVSQKFTLKNIITFGSVACLGIGAFLWYSHVQQVDRVVNNLNSQSVFAQLLIRFQPAYVYFQKLTVFNVFVGFGLGTTFYIPWFAYVNIDTIHNRIDSTFITMFVKLGLVSLLYYFFLLKYIVSKTPFSGLKKGIILFFVVYMITTPMIFHGFLTLAILYFIVLCKTEAY